MYDGMFVFDNVVHMYDNGPVNAADPIAQQTAAVLIGFGHKFADETYEVNDHFLGTTLSVEEATRRLFVESDTDMAMAQVIPVFGAWKDGFSPVRSNHALAAANPERVIFCGGVDPLFEGVDRAKAEMQRQVEELGARSFKFYNVDAVGRSWSCDDRDVAYPLYEKALELGVTCLQFHKGVPFGPRQRVEDLKPNDLQRPAVDFPDVNFVIHHLGDPYVTETVNIAARNKNVYLALSSWINMHPFEPMASFHRLGQALRFVGPDRLLYGSEAFIWPTLQPYIRLFAEMEMPDELQEGYGYPALTRETKEKILGLNMARLLDIDVEAKNTELAATPVQSLAAS